MTKRFLSKSKLSTYLRTQCDRQLYLSLFSNDPKELNLASLPIPLKTRTSIQLITQSGRDFEHEQFDRLVAALPNNTISGNNYAPIPLKTALQGASVPSLILQPAFEPEEFKDQALSNLHLSPSEKATIPTLTGLRPDLLYLHDPVKDDYEVLPTGNRKWIDVKSETRKAISVLDLKNVTESNASYAAEVCLYVFFLSNWLEFSGLSASFYVSHKVYLWRNIEMPRFNKMISSRQGGDPLKRIAAVFEDLEDGLVDFLIYFPSVKKFFKEDIPRVVTKGDTDGWDAVAYHVNPKCGSCDWLGNVDWLRGESLAIYQKHPEHYCLYAAEKDDHLSKMAGLSKGASYILKDDGKLRLADLVDIAPETSILTKHSFLKKDKSQIGSKARAIVDGVSSIDNSVRIGSLAKHRHAEYCIIVNFDSGAGLLTGISIRGTVFFPFGQKIDVDGQDRGYISFHEEAFVIGKDNHLAERASLLSFIEKFASWITRADELFQSNSWGSVQTQICFWEQRQYMELCNAFGRHLLEILDLSERSQKALAWIFPAEELMEKDELVAPGIVFIKDVVEASIRPAIKFSNTLLGIASVYHHPKLLPRKIDNYYREPLGDAIPRERIFEIWKSPAGVVSMYGKPAPVADAIAKYGEILEAHAWALSSVAAQLRTDLSSRLKAKAPSLSLSIPSGATRIAYDSKLWLQWDKVETATALTEGKANLITKAERLEASYKSIVLLDLVQNLGNNRYIFNVSAESTESKLEEGSYYVLGYVDDPGFPIQTPASLGVVASTTYDPSLLWVPLNNIVRVVIHIFDRANRRIEISIRETWGKMTPVFNDLLNQGFLPINEGQIYIIESLPWSDLATTDGILRSIGNPAIATPSGEALIALGSRANRVVKSGTDTITPVSRVLWNAADLQKNEVRTEADAKAIASFARSSNKYGLNESQEKAVFNCALKQLTVIWGPPGTGKTNTLAALIHALTYESQTKNQTRKVLITGPNYRAVEELAERTLKSMDRDQNCVCDFFMVYTQSREPKQFDNAQPHINLSSFSLKNDPATESLLRDSLQDANKITIVATTAHAIANVTKLLYGRDSDLIQSIYDLVIIDESSQVPVNLALRPLAALKPTGQIIIAGDHLQMPPISSLEPPKNAEYLVGSIQTYLIKRFPEIKKATQTLLINYRSNQDIVDFAKSIGYPFELQAHEKDRKLHLLNAASGVIESLPEGLPISNAYEDILDINKKVITLIHEDIVSSQANEFEAKLVAGIAYCLRHATSADMFPSDSGFAPFSDDIFFKRGLGIVTPHKAQKALVLRELRKLFPAVPPELIFESVDTVERFQGGERQTVIVSFGVGDTDIITGEEAFLLQMERTNVAVSRAKAKCIVLMPKALAYHLPTDEKVAKTSKAIKSYIEEFCDKRKDVQIIDHLNVVRNGEIRWH